MKYIISLNVIVLILTLQKERIWTMLECQRNWPKCIITIILKKVLHETCRRIDPVLFICFYSPVCPRGINKAKLSLNHSSFNKLLYISELTHMYNKFYYIIFMKYNVLNCKIYLKSLAKCLAVQIQNFLHSNYKIQDSKNTETWGSIWF